MAAEPKIVDVSNWPELTRLAEEACATGRPQLLQRAGEDLALLLPISNATGRDRSRAEAMGLDYAAFRSAAGGWHDVDTDRLIQDIYEGRRSARLPLEL